MKQLSVFLSVLIILLLMNHCDKDKILNDNSKNVIESDTLFVLSGFLHNEFTAEPLNDIGVYWKAETDTGQLRLVAFSDTSGYFTIDSLIEGAYFIAFLDDDYYENGDRIVISQDTTVQYTMVKKPTVNLDIQVQEKTIYSIHIPIKGVKITFNGNDYITNDSGKVYIPNIRSGEYDFIFYHEDYDSLFKINFQIPYADEGQVLPYLFEMRYIKQKYDYFPLGIGNYWKYDLTKSYGDAVSGNSFKGSMEWKVEGISDETEKTVFNILQILNGETIRFDAMGTPYDTTFQQNDSSYFNIEQNESRQLHIFTTPWYFYLYSSPYWDIERYYSPNHPDTLKIDMYYSCDPGKFRYVKNIGMVYFNYFKGPNAWSNTTAELVDYEVIN